MSDSESRIDSSNRPSHPTAILEDTSLDDQQKRQYLEDWRADLLELQTATEENMSGDPAAAGEISEQLRSVTAALATLPGPG